MATLKTLKTVPGCQPLKPLHHYIRDISECGTAGSAHDAFSDRQRDVVVARSTTERS